MRPTNCQPKESNVVRLAADISPETVSEQARSVDMQFYTGAVVDRYDYSTGEKYKLRLGLNKGQCDIGKIKGGPLLDSHMDYSVKNVLGVISNPRIEGGMALATATFSDDAESDSIFRKVKNGTLSKVSVGAVILHLSKESEADGVSTYVADKWYPREVSIVPIPADPDAGFLADQLPIQKLMDQPEPEALRATAHEVKTVEELKTTTPAGSEPPKVIDIAAVKLAAKTEERSRAGAIRKAATSVGLSAEFSDSLIASDISLADARGRIIDELATISESTKTIPHQSGSVIVEKDSRDKSRESLQNAIEHRAGVRGVKLEAGREFGGMTLLRLAEKSLELSGVKFAGANSLELSAMALGMRVERFSNPGYGGTTDFPLILGNVMNKSLRAAYEAYPQTWRPIATGTTVADFKTKYVNQLSEAPTPVVIGPSGEYKYFKMTDKRESYAIQTYGGIIALNRQAIINDDMSAFNRIPQAQGASFAMLESDIVWALITSNPTMGADSVALFHASHGNLVGTGTVINVANLGIMRAAMRVQKNLQSVQYINATPKYLAVPAALEMVANQFTSTQYVAATQSAINPNAGLSVIVEPRLDVASATAWYAFADPSQVAVIEYAYLAGQEGIYTETRVGFDVDGMEMKARQDFGAQVLDWRGTFKNVGA